MKKTMNILAAGAMALCLGACSGSSGASSFGCVGTGDTAIVTAINAKVNSEAHTDIEVKENTPVRVQSALESGKVRIVLTKQGASQASVDYEFSVESDVEYQLDPGTYTVAATVTEKANGGVVVDASGVSASTNAAPAAAEESGQNPVMNFIGNYAEGRCNILVEAKDQNEASFTVTWSSSMAEHSEWKMSGVFDQETLTVNYDNCTKANVTFNEDGTEASRVVEYENGKGSFTFTQDLSLTWKDEMEDAAKDLVFKYAN